CLDVLDLGLSYVAQLRDLEQPDAGQELLLFLVPRTKDRLVAEIFDPGHRLDRLRFLRPHRSLEDDDRVEFRSRGPHATDCGDERDAAEFADELAVFGAKISHEPTIEPLGLIPC